MSGKTPKIGPLARLLAAASVVGRKLLFVIPVLLVTGILNFILLHMAPGDAVSAIAGEAGGASPEYVAQMRAQFGLDQPMPLQLLYYVGNLLQLSLGYSFRNAMPVSQLILERLWPTVLLMASSLFLSLVVGVVLGIVAATKVNSLRDNVISVSATVAYAVPLFWAGLMLIVLFAVKLDWFPTTGMEDVTAFYEGWDRVFDIAYHLVLPMVSLSLLYTAFYTRLMRASMLTQSNMDYITTARAKGLTERQITMRHAIRNAILPVVAMAGVQIGNLLGGSVVIESVFAWPGLGTLAFDALRSRDFNLLLGIFFLSACLVVAVNLVIDAVYAAIDPRITSA
jgi:peptide/nickel transport system permease protein